MRVLITRPRAQAEAFAVELATLGVEAVVAPLIEIMPLPGPSPDLTGVQALLITSANGGRAFAALSPERALPVFAVGEETAAELRRLGFGQVESAAGDASDLARLVATRLDPSGGTLLHLRGRDSGLSLAELLRANGYRLREAMLYEARTASAFGDDLKRTLGERGKLDAALFFSPRTAEVFVRLAFDAGLADACARLQALCLSSAVAAAARALPWAAVRVAERPDRRGMLDLVAAGHGSRRTPPRRTTPRRNPDEKLGLEPAIMTSDGDSDNQKPEGDGPTAPTTPAQRVIRRFGGIRPMAQKLGVPVSTVQGWKERGVIPSGRRDEVMAAAQRHGFSLDPADLGEGALGSDLPPPPETGPSAPWGSSSTPETPTDSPRLPPAPEFVSPSPTAEPPRASAGGPARRGSGLAAIAFGLSLLALLAALSAPWWTEALGLRTSAEGDPGLANRLAEAELRLQQLEGRPDSGAELALLAERVNALESAAEALRTEIDRIAAAPGITSEGTSRPETDAAVAELRSRLDAVAADMESLRQAARTAASPEEVRTLRDEIDAARAELKAMQAALSALVDLPARIAQLGDRIEAAAAQTEKTAFVLAVGQLEAALDSGGPFASELRSVRRLAEADEDLARILDPLALRADRGVPTRAELNARFDETALSIAQASAGSGAESWIDRALARLRSLVTVRPVGKDVEGDSADARLARAEARLAEGDLAGAVTELEGLDGAAVEAAAVWLADARARIAAEEAVTRLQAKALARISPDGSAPAGGASGQGG